MVPRRFRRRSGPWRYILLGLAVLCLTRWVWTKLSDGPIDPSVESIAPGEYILRRVNDDGAIEVFVTTPENEDNRRWIEIELLGIESFDASVAAEKTRQLLGAGPVRLRLDRRRLSDQARLLAYVFVGDEFINAQLVREGWAREATHPADSGPMVRQIKQAEVEAREHLRGFWRPQ